MRLIRPGTELRRFMRSPMSRAAIAVAALIPLLYGALYLWAFWNPTGHLDRMPVALVMADAGATDSSGAAVTAGRTVADTLTDDATLGWVETSASDADQGLLSGRYYAVLTIPRGFSEAVVTAGTDHAVQAPLQVLYDDADGVTSRTIVASVMREVRAAVSDSVGEDMVSKLLVGVDDIRTGLVKASDGAGTLASGTDDARSGSAKLAEGASTLASGNASAASGAHQLTTGAQQASAGASALASGLPQAKDAAGQLATGAGSVASGADQLATRLDAGAAKTADLPDQTKQLATGAAQVASGSAALSSQLKASSPTMATNAAQLRALLASELPAGSPGLTAFDSYTTQVSGAFTRTSGAVDKLAAGSASVSAGTDKLAAGADDITTGFKDAAAGAHQISSGAAQVSDGNAQLSTKLADAATGASTLATGVSTIAAKEADLAIGLDKLSTGSNQVHAGLVTLDDGLGKMGSGSHELADKLTSAVAEVPSFTAAQRDANATVMSSPVTLDTTYVHEAAGVGEGMAPYFIGLSLYVGAMIMWMLLRPLSQRLLAAPVPASRVVIANATPAIHLGALQVAFLAATLVFGLGLHVNHLAAFVGFALLVSAAFVTLQQALNIWFGASVGRLATLVLLMLQLTSAGGTYPAVTSDPFFQVLHQIMPMTQVVNGLREAITGDLNATFAAAVVSLAAVVVAGLALSVWGAARSRTWTITRLHPAVSL